MSQTLTLTPRKTASVGDGPHLHIGYVKEAGRIWVSNTGGDTISLLDATSGEHVAEFEVGGGPAHFAFDKGCRIGYVALSSADAVAVVDPLGARLLNVVPLPSGSMPTGIMPAFDRDRVYTLNQGDGTVSAIDTRANAVAATIAVGGHPAWGQPWGSSYKPITRPVGKSYVVSTEAESVAVFDDATDTLLTRISVGHRPVRNAIYRERAEIFVANAADATVSVIPIDSNEVAATIPVGTAPFRLLPVQAINGRDEMWVLNEGHDGEAEGSISVVSGAGREVVDRILVGGHPINWVVNGDGYLFVVSATGPELCVVDILTGHVVTREPLTSQPHPGAVSGLIYSQADSLFVLNADRTVSVFDVDNSHKSSRV
jgi:YVTN family beta-propeller protein